MSAYRDKIVLIIDDEPAMLEIVEIFVTDLGAKACLAPDGLTALKILQTQPVSLILSDIKMPGLNGLDLMRKLNAQCINVPVVYLSGYSDRDLVLRALRLGALDFISKPFRQAEFAKVLRRALAVSERQQQVADLLDELRQTTTPQTCELIDQLQRQISLLRVIADEVPPM